MTFLYVGDTFFQYLYFSLFQTIFIHLSSTLMLQFGQSVILLVVGGFIGSRPVVSVNVQLLWIGSPLSPKFTFLPPRSICANQCCFEETNKDVEKKLSTKRRAQEMPAFYTVAVTVIYSWVYAILENFFTYNLPL